MKTSPLEHEVTSPEASPGTAPLPEPNKKDARRDTDLGNIPPDDRFLEIKRRTELASEECRRIWMRAGNPCTTSIFSVRRDLSQLASLLRSIQTPRASQFADEVDSAGRGDCTEVSARLPHLAPQATSLALFYQNVRVPQINITSTPSEAEVSIRPRFGTGGERTLDTDGSFINLPRGLYTLNVRRKGYISHEMLLDLIDDTRSNVRCKLGNEKVSDDVTTCHRE